MRSKYIEKLTFTNENGSTIEFSVTLFSIAISQKMCPGCLMLKTRYIPHLA
jgi:hypothetical protein